MNFEPCLHHFRTAQTCVGTWLSSGAPVTAELAAGCGFDWVLLDMEHGLLTETDLVGNLQALQGTATLPVVRVPNHEPSLIGRVLDRGAGGIMVPRISSAEETEAVVRAMRFAPRGERGFSSSARTFGYGLRPAEAAAPDPLLMVQIETVRGLREVSRIAAVDGVDILFVGPSDLKQELSSMPDAPAYETALDLVCAAAKETGRGAGILIRDLEEAAALIRRGFTKPAVQSDLGILRTGFSNALRICRK